MSGQPITDQSPAAPAVAPRGKIIMMAVIAGAVITNIYCTQPILPLIASDMGVDVTTVDLVAGSALLGFATGLALLLPMGDRFDRRKLVLGQIALAFCFALAAAFSSGIWALVAASFGLGIVSCVPQQLVPFAAVMSQPHERGRNVGTVVSGIMVGILLGRTIAGVVGEAYGWRAVYAMEAAFMMPVWIAAAKLLPRGVPSTNLSYPRLLASLWPLMRDNSPIRQSMMVQALLWACFNAFWVNLAALLAHGPWQLGSAWAGGFGIIGAAGALAASLGGRASDRLGSRKVIGASIGDCDSGIPAAGGCGDFDYLAGAGGDRAGHRGAVGLGFQPDASVCGGPESSGPHQQFVHDGDVFWRRGGGSGQRLVDGTVGLDGDCRVWGGAGGDRRGNPLAQCPAPRKGTGLTLSREYSDNDV